MVLCFFLHVVFLFPTGIVFPLQEMSVDMLVARQGGLVKELVLDQWTCSTLLGWIREEIEADASTVL